LPSSRAELRVRGELWRRRFGIFIAGDGNPVPCRARLTRPGANAPNTIAGRNGKAIIVDNQAQNTTAVAGDSVRWEPDRAGTPQPPVPAPAGLTVDPTNEFVYASATNSNTVSAYRLDPVSLALEPVPRLQVADWKQSLVIGGAGWFKTSLLSAEHG